MPDPLLNQLATALRLDDDRVAAILELGGADPSADRSTDEAVLAFLDGLIVDRRGPRDPSLPPPPARDRLTNNLVLKKLRVALTLHEADMLRILDVGGSPMTNRELTTLFRKPGHKHYRKCSHEVLAAFLAGLAAESPA